MSHDGSAPGCVESRSLCVPLAAVICCALLCICSPAVGQGCVGDCDADVEVSVAELVRCVNIAAGSRPAGDCLPCDVSGDGRFTVDELVPVSELPFLGKGLKAGPARKPESACEIRIGSGVGAVRRRKEFVGALRRARPVCFRELFGGRLVQQAEGGARRATSRKLAVSTEDHA